MEIQDINNKEVQQQSFPVVQNSINFNGNGSQLLVIMLVNNILTILTLGLYYPWARVKSIKYLYENTSLNQTNFEFLGTGAELFKGFIKFFVFIIVFYGLIFYASTLNNPIYNVMVSLVFLVAITLIIPVAIHGSLRYRLSRTTWRGIHFGYRGMLFKFFIDYLLGSFISLFTMGIYQSWFVNKMRTYVIGNIRFGSIQFGYDGKGDELFIINLKALIFVPLTFGMYYFWYRAEYIRYFANHTYLEQDGQKFYLKANLDGANFFSLSLVNIFLTLFTFGLGVPFVIIRTIDFFISNLEIPSGIDLDVMQQTEDEYKDATGDDVMDYFDIGLV